MPQVLKDLLGSKRVIATLGGIVFVLFKDRVPGITITEDQTIYIVGLIASWVVGDSIRGLPKSPVEPKA
jgi:hypothetical protein